MAYLEESYYIFFFLPSHHETLYDGNNSVPLSAIGRNAFLCSAEIKLGPSLAFVIIVVALLDLKTTENLYGIHFELVPVSEKHRSTLVSLKMTITNV